jgi:5'-3' exonuclease
MIKVIIDFSQMIYNAYFVNVQKEPTESFAFLRFLILKQIMNINTLFNPNEIILACDTRSWRKEIFPQYKAKRVKNSDITKLFEESDIFLDELKSKFPYKVLKINRAEADDIISTLSFNKKEEDIYYIISNDKDFLQLTKYKNVSIYNPREEEFVEFPFIKDKREFNKVEDWVCEHLLRGDSGDGIPNILSDDDTFINEEKSQVRLSKNVVKKINEEGLEKQKFYNRNKNLIMLEKDIIPKEIQEEIMNKYEKINIINENNIEKIHELFEAYNMQSLFGKEKKFLLNQVKEIKKENVYDNYF